MHEVSGEISFYAALSNKVRARIIKISVAGEVKNNAYPIGR